MSTQSWQIPCPRCGWANSGALTKCAKCGQPLGVRPGLLVAGQSLSAKAELPKSNKVARPGGFLPRLIALIIDASILGAILLPINALWVAQLVPLDIKPDTNVALETLQRRASLFLALVLIQLFYFAGSWTMLGATPGQLLMGLRVTNARAGGIGFFKAIWRWLMKTGGWLLTGIVTALAGPVLGGLLAFIVLATTVLSALMVAFSKNKRALHDVMAGTYVIQVVDAAELPEGDTGLPAAFGGQPDQGRAVPSPAPAPIPPPAAAPVAPLSAAVASTADYGSARPAEPVSKTEYAPAAPPTEFPAPPMAPHGHPAELYVPAPLPGPPPAGPAGPEGGDDGLYSPPPMIDPTTTLDDFSAPPPALPAEREVYSPKPGQMSERALKSAELYSTVPEFAAPAPVEPATPAPAASDPAAAADQHPIHEPAAPAPEGGEPPPLEFPPMAPPPESHR